MTQSNHELRFDGVTKRFDGEPAVENVSARIVDGERVALVGPSGAGKTTLLRLANSSLQPDSGDITFDGEHATSDDIALAYQGGTLVDRRTALSNVLSGRVGDLSWWRGLLEPISPRNPEPALELLDSVGLRAKASQRVDQLSAGERQRVAFARAVIQDAPAVLADEPTANLDPSSRATVLDVLDSVTEDRILLTVLHDIDLALDRYDRVIGIADGRVRFDAPPADVTDQMLSDLFAAGASTRDSDERTGGRDSKAATEEPQWYV
ncbi:phosphonate ABC transporter ATP-binding protein [Salinibaculum salinum]|uniref:phosphonate ABC transporter ATP-binding protein n=1 Tax=Salinibaculum salinum TaxID=3131996 RepID=UPI0030EE662E